MTSVSMRRLPGRLISMLRLGRFSGGWVGAGGDGSKGVLVGKEREGKEDGCAAMGLVMFDQSERPEPDCGHSPCSGPPDLYIHTSLWRELQQRRRWTRLPLYTPSSHHRYSSTTYSFLQPYPPSYRSARPPYPRLRDEPPSPLIMRQERTITIQSRASPPMSVASSCGCVKICPSCRWCVTTRKTSAAMATTATSDCSSCDD